MGTLYLITARGGSKGLPGKNIRPLNGKPLIHYSIDLAREFADDEDICLSTDDEQIIKCASGKKLKVAFVRPAELASDTADSYSVIMHALDQYEKSGKSYDQVVLLQPTSPLRLKAHLENMLKLMKADLDMVASVCETHTNPLRNLFSADAEGLLTSFAKNSKFERRQDAPKFYEINGAFYLLNVTSLKKQAIRDFERIKMYEMPRLNAVDIDTLTDWMWAEFILEKKLVNLDYE
jgi:CMP-N,N'-diacetyllegionaminic acid synthase